MLAAPQTRSHRNDQTEELVATFKTRCTLVVSALAALESMSATLALLNKHLTASPAEHLIAHVDRLYRLVESAAVGADNLLVSPHTTADRTFLTRAIGRQPSGAVNLRTIEIDRDALVLTGGDGAHALDRLAASIRAIGPAPRGPAALALEELTVRIRNGMSRLSLFKARLDLQESFLSSVLDADPGGPCVRMESHLNQASARDLAQEARRLLSGHSITVARGNRNTLASLFAGDPHGAT